MIQFTATLQKFADQGEKTGWTYIDIPQELADKLKPENRQSFRVKGKIDQHKISGIALFPMKGGGFIMTVNAGMRKAIGKRHGAMVKVQLEADKKGYVMNKDFMACLGDEPAASEFFKTLTGGHQRYFSKWIDDAKTVETKTKRIVMAVTALAKKMGYPEMVRANKKENL